MPPARFANALTSVPHNSGNPCIMSGSIGTLKNRFSYLRSSVFICGKIQPMIPMTMPM
ncbi:hypothetical protein [Argonema antarcticum]|uniref:hypothetical protein n=1 Tax=Argonema antarcticum TaxID=2942763 RepID=UPI002012494A|nr:hypothetical protein [Argonema antarcticum]MCL1470107.1 hypothetical protein [Argonema antarcticum A004/B2]